MIDEDTPGIADIVGPGQTFIATVHGGYDGDDADARLIAAAPTMYEGLLQIIAMVQDDARNDRDCNGGRIQHLAHDLIAKAEGKE